MVKPQSSTLTKAMAGGAFEMTQKELMSTLKMCEYYLNEYIGATSKQYYTRLRARTLKDLLRLQIKEHLK